jgi:hypothetical protein
MSFFYFFSEDGVDEKPLQKGPVETPMPDVGKERSYWLKGDVFSKATGATETASAAAEDAGPASFKFSFGGQQTAGGAAFSMLQKHGKPKDENYA